MACYPLQDIEDGVRASKVNCIPARGVDYYSRLIDSISQDQAWAQRKASTSVIGARMPTSVMVQLLECGAGGTVMFAIIMDSGQRSVGQGARRER
ncbi:hypothetical protein BDW02DRAFT_568888 [Decorospora gaudefroyi]|uniref:Uncharacterized protein n=1 Tax=Decorospora gaudefroyi TaxID=184978 RepID=A0A6A5KGV2_9PLEO|nr:hypothetical protein BDW02DRAFT_568888 [Decorospora gaudefroyi]